MKLLIITIIFGVTSTIINSQELNKLPVIDSLKIDNNSIENLFYKLDEFEFYRDLTELKRDFSINAETAKLWLEASLNTLNKSSFNKENNLTPGYLHSSLYEQYLEDSKFNPFRTALGMIQAGAVGYLAYRHIKKWVIKK
ncbi:MAG: hypothetical protein A2V93_12545 [Ignavibacteria bacterium RBG_16_34_14]|nr:MAG: hypothetical protein A2V93_12545 [Ignavibacteria bacterium RBG_16_34_14]